MPSQPKITLHLTAGDKLLEALGLIVMLASWVIVIVNYNNLPDIIPIHYNAAGEADGFGSKRQILSLPTIATVMFLALTILNKFPHVFNYPVMITEANALRNYTNATRMVRYLKFVIALIFGLIALQTIRSVNEQIDNLGAWFLPATLALLFLPLFYFLVKLILSKVDD